MESGLGERLGGRSALVELLSASLLVSSFCWRTPDGPSDPMDASI